MHRKLLATAICASLTMPLWATVAHAHGQPDGASGQAATQTEPQDSKDKSDKDKAARLQAIQVTGTLIPKAQIETAAPVIQITAEEINAQGFKNVAEALRSLPQASGAVLDSQFTNGFTPGASTISLFGLSPSYTLTLIDGHPLSDYPLLYNSNTNIVDLSTIPMAMVDHIDIVPGNQSAIYGSAAIAGVVNIILKQNVTGHTLSVRGGGYSQGGGGNQRVQFVGGQKFGKLDMSYALEYSNQNAIFRYQRSYMDSTLRNPTGKPVYPSLDYWRLNGSTNRYIDPGQANCDRVAGQFDGTVIYAQRPQGRYCGSYSDGTYGTIMNKARNYNGYLSLKYRVNDNIQLYGDVMYNDNETIYYNGFNTFWWGTGVAVPTYIYNTNTRLYERLQRVFSPEEVGRAADRNLRQKSSSTNFGARGTLGDSDWMYDAYAHLSTYRTNSKYLRPLAGKVDAYFLGPQQGMGPNGRYPAYALDLNRFYSTVPLSDILSFSDYVRSDSRTWRADGNAQISNTRLFTLPAGDVGFAAVVQVGKEYWHQPIDPRAKAGLFWGTGGTSGKGDRKSQAAAMEFNVPIFSTLTASVAGRYDNYEYAGTGDDRVTWKAGLEFRPVDSLLLRANVGTAFRAPEMAYIFSAPSRSYSTVTDYWQCRLIYGDRYASNPGLCPATLTSVQIQSSSSGNPNLKSVTAKSWGYGIVWSPLSNLSLHVDYARIPISNEVASRSVSNILSMEASCRLGHTVNGTPIDGTSGMCQQIYQLITRNPADAPFDPNQLIKVTTYPLNIASEVVANVTAGVDWTVKTERYGRFAFGSNFYRALKHTTKTFPEDPVYDRLNSRDWGFGTEFRYIGSANVAWSYGKFTTTLYGRRYAPTWSYDGSRKIGPWMIYNASVKFDVRDNVTLLLSSNNVLNKRPPVDTTNGSYPYFDQFNYNAYGRSIMAEMSWKID